MGWRKWRWPTWKAQYTIYAILLVLAVTLIYINIQIYAGAAGPDVVPTLGADAEWAIAALAVYLVVFELRKRRGGGIDNWNDRSDY